MKWKLSTLALIGISLCTSGMAETNGNQMTPDMQAFYRLLNSDAREKFMQLDNAHRQAAMEIYHSYCKAANQCGGHREQAVEEQYYDQTQGRKQLNNGMKNH